MALTRAVRPLSSTEAAASDPTVRCACGTDLSLTDAGKCVCYSCGIRVHPTETRHSNGRGRWGPASVIECDPSARAAEPVSLGVSTERPSVDRPSVDRRVTAVSHEISPGPHENVAPRSDIASISPELSAEQLLSGHQKRALVAIMGCAVLMIAARVLAGIGPSPLWWAQVSIAIVTLVYIVVISFKGMLIHGARRASVIQFTPEELCEVPDSELPRYTVLVPLYREGAMLPVLLEKLGGLDYPVDRLQVLLLIEEDDRDTRLALDTLDLGSQFEVVLIPDSPPRTKPKACNVGLTRATGEFCVIYDAEDRPEPDQLRKAVAAFRHTPDWVVCVQAELQYWNPWTNGLTRCFAAEYAMNFSLVLLGLDRFHLPIPLGGTSNHFQMSALCDLGAWDPHNVTEDADLGVRIARRGWTARMMASVTEEEANSHLGNWLRQRSRWIKGYLQTWLVHMRSPVRLFRELGPRQFFAFHMTVGFSTFTTLVNPIFWFLTLTYLVTGPQHIEKLFPPAILYLGLASMLIGNLLVLYYFMIGCMERGLYRAVRTMLVVPLYWAAMSVAAYKAILQLLRPTRRHYWELTRHGLVSELSGTPALAPQVASPAYAASEVAGRARRFNRLISNVTIGGLVVVLVTLFHMDGLARGLKRRAPGIEACDANGRSRIGAR